MTGRPAACASIAAIPNSSVAVTTSARQDARRAATSASPIRPANRTVGPAMRRRRRASGPSPITVSGRFMRVNACTARSRRLWAMSSASTT